MWRAGLISALLLVAGTATAETKPDTPIKVLIVTGGCCHNYPKQREILETGLKARLNVTVSHLYYDPKPGEQATRPKLPIFDNPNYGDGYDVIIHNECAADESDPQIIDTVLSPHQKGIPYTGIQSSGHGPQSPITLTIAPEAHAITQGLNGWTTSKDELYNNLTTFNVTPLIYGIQPESSVTADRDKTFTVAWIHSYGPKNVRVFSTTLAHNEANMREDAYLDLVANGVAWASGRLN
ncbi:MAG: hypothetical protein B7Z26_05790 [Asticcacaulis sp. 32-58-5]|nr:MAG: hypothetical protein B7Z26_05790 [Asticcacaulis sp. 32-58-5]